MNLFFFPDDVNARSEKDKNIVRIRSVHVVRRSFGTINLIIAV